MVPVGVIWLFLVLTSIFPPFRGYPPTQASKPSPTFLPSWSASGICYTSKNLSKMAGSSASYPLNC